MPSVLSSLLLELNIHLPPSRMSVVVDHFNHDTSSSGQHDVLLLPQPSLMGPGLRSFFGGDGTIAFPRATAQELGSNSPLIMPILRARNTSYSYNPKEDTEAVEDPFAVGEQISLVSAMQARNSARLTVFGSVEGLEDKWFDAELKSSAGSTIRTANRDFASRVSAWTFQELGVLKVGRIEHHLSTIDQISGGNDSLVQLGYPNPTIYRIKNDVVRYVDQQTPIIRSLWRQTFKIEISEYFFEHLSPFKVDTHDAVQLEFTMLSPFHRIDLVPASETPNSTIFSTTFQLPDQHGIFRFQVNYKRPFLTNVDVKQEVTVRHFAHDEWPRSWQISAGWVWIAGVWTTIFGWVAFVGIWLWSESAYEEGKGKKKQ